jgi:hypothetical protein
VADNQTDVVSNTWLGITMSQSTSLLVQLGAFLAAITVIFKWYLNDFAAFYSKLPYQAVAILAAFPLYLLCFSIVPQALRRYRKARRNDVTLSDVPSVGYFRLDPVVTTTPQEFRREDDAHNEVLRWIHATTRPVLFLSGVSGSGKSSVLEAYVLPMLRSEGWRIELIRTFDNPLPQLDKVLGTWSPGNGRMLVVFDQFEEFVVLEERTSAEARRQFVARVQAVCQTPPSGLCLLFSFRRDYMRSVVGLKLDDLTGQNYTEIDAFRRDEARRFLEGAPGKPGPALVERLLAGAEALDDVPARFRPITLNMLGLALQEFDRQVTAPPERLIQGYMEAAIAQPEIKEIAPSVVETMITAANTKAPRSVKELEEKTALRSQDIRVCLMLLARRGLVRQLDAAQGVWEISHDFVARQFAILLGRLRPSPWPKVAMYAAPMLFVLMLVGLLVGVLLYVHQQAVAELRTLDVAVTLNKNTHGLKAVFPNDANDQELTSAMPDLHELGVSDLDLSGTQVTTLPALPGSLLRLDLSGTKVRSNDPVVQQAVAKGVLVSF